MRHGSSPVILLWFAAAAALAPVRARFIGRGGALASSAITGGAADGVLSSAAWPALKRELDALPVWCCADEDGKPLQYERDGKPLALFYADVDAARVELASARSEFPALALDILPFGLGEAFQLSRLGAAVLVPSNVELQAAGAPPGAPAMGQELPLFACLEISQQLPDGRFVLPMFMSYAEAKAALDEASAADEADGGDSAAPLQLVGLSLNKAIEQLVTVPDTPAFHFVPPASSLAFIERYLSDSGGTKTDMSEL